MKILIAMLSLVFSSAAFAAPKTLECENFGTLTGSKVLAENKESGLLEASLTGTQGDYEVQVFAWQPLPGSLITTENVIIILENKKTGMHLISGNYIGTRQIKDNNEAYIQFTENGHGNTPHERGEVLIVSCQLK